jgi:hypothetical protein
MLIISSGIYANEFRNNWNHISKMMNSSTRNLILFIFTDKYNEFRIKKI